MSEDITIENIEKALENYGEILAIKINNNKTAFITFKERKDAENAINNLYKTLIINEKNYVLRWKRDDNQSN